MINDLLHTFHKYNDPHPYWIIDNFLKIDIIDKVHKSFDESLIGNFDYDHVSQRKIGQTDLLKMHTDIQNVILFLCSNKFINILEEITGEKDLIPDLDLHGGGLHQTSTGGFLKIHKDFATHPKHKTWKRRYNLLIYITKNTDQLENANLEFWSDDLKDKVISIAPKYNRAVIFDTSNLFHGHPHPLNAPDEARKSIALYYFSDTGISQKTQSTVYRGTKLDSSRERIRIYLDSFLVGIYNSLKRQFNFPDKFIQRFVYFAKFLLGKK